jgi:transcriptional regulator with XRE-family HTH domain
MSGTSGQACDSSESFGRRLRLERERRQIALTSIAENSKISVSLLRDLERDDVSKWPPGIFRRSFMRAYAQAVGLDVEATTHEFLERFPDPDPDGLNAPQSTLPASPLRLTLADTGASFAPGRILAPARVRCLAIACDAAVIVTLGLAMGLVLNTLWMPLCLAMIGYYAGGILLLGNTPGVRLCAPGRRPKSLITRHQDVAPDLVVCPLGPSVQIAAAGDCDITISDVDAEQATQRPQALPAARTRRSRLAMTCAATSVSCETVYASTRTLARAHTRSRPAPKRPMGELRADAVNARSRGAVDAKRRGIDGAEHSSIL